MIAGLGMQDMAHLSPGFVMDAFVYRQKFASDNPLYDVR